MSGPLPRPGNAGWRSYGWLRQNRRTGADTVRVGQGMDRIDATQIPEPGLVVFDITAHDETTAPAGLVPP